MNRKKLFWLLSVLMVAALVLTACPGGNPPAEPAAAQPTVAAAATEAPAEEAAAEATEAPAEEAAAEATEAPAEEEAAAPAVVNEGGTLERALAGEFSGTVVSMSGPFEDEDAVKFNNSIAAFEEQTGIDIQYEGTKEFETTISVRVDAGDPPDIADFPQPGLLANFVAAGKVVDMSAYLSTEYMEGQYLQSWLDMATMEGPDGPVMAGVWHRFNGKSLVWYPKAAFDEAGYTIPTTWDELLELTQTIADDGDTAWCIGIESGTATGWPATDWIEEIMLRTQPLENYDAWITGELKFDSPEVKNAVEIMGNIWLNDAYVYGGRATIVSTAFGDSTAPMFQDPPHCWLHKQGNFITSFFPPGTEAGVDYDFFYLPSIDEAYGKPFLVAGDIMAAFSDRPEVIAVMEYFTRGEAVKEWLAAGGALSPHRDASLDWYGNDVERGVAALANEATSVRFDGSDLMPGEVGSGSFWKGMTDYIAGTTDLDTAMQEIDAAWPSE